MSLFKKIKSAFVIEDEKTEQSVPVKKSVETGSTEEPNMNEALTVRSEPSYATPDGKVNQQFTNILLKAIEAQNQEGFDYIEFKQSIQNLLKMDMDEATVYKSAYATAQTLGATPDGLTASAQRYLSVLEKEEGKFNRALSNQRSKQIDGGLGEIKNLEQAIQNKLDQIEQLKQEVETSKSKLVGMKQEIEEANLKIETTRQDFIASYSNLVSQINLDVENISKYLK